MANSYMIQIYSSDIEPMVKELASEDMRSIGNEVAWLIRQEFDRRNPEGSTVQDREIQLAAKSQ